MSLLQIVIAISAAFPPPHFAMHSGGGGEGKGAPAAIRLVEIKKRVDADDDGSI